MNEKFDSSDENFSPGNHLGDRYQNEVVMGVAAFLLHYIPFVGATGGIVAMTLVPAGLQRSS